MSEVKQLGGGEPQPAEIEFGDVGVKLQTAQDAWRFAKRCFDSGMLPEQIQNANQAFVILCKGAELGLPAFASWSWVYLTKARRLALMTKGALAVVQSKPSFGGYKEWIEAEGTPEMKAVAVAQRKGREPTVKEFSLKDAETAKLLGRRVSSKGNEYDGPWQSFLKDMLLSRARGRALELTFAAELGGIALEGIAEDIDMMEARQQDQVTRVGRAGGALPDRRPAALPAATVDPLFEELLSTQRRINEVQMARVESNEAPPAPAARAAEQPIEVEPMADDDGEDLVVVSPPALVRTIESLDVPPEPRPNLAHLDGRNTVPESSTVTKVVKGTRHGAETKLCGRCKAALNTMGGCDVCGWPGADNGERPGRSSR
jgi:hypothetical protein